MSTTYEIAKKAGVSQATVSRVLNGNPAVKPETRQRVMEWVRKLEYQPNLAAQSVFKKQSLLLGIILPDITNPYFSEILKSVEQSADLNGYNIVLCESRGNLQKEKQCLNILRSHRVAGALLVPIDREASLLNISKQSHMPVVSITNDMKSLDSVYVSHVRGGALAANHLLELGHTRMAFIGPPGDEKFRGFYDVLHSRRVSFSDENLVALESFWGQEGFNDVYKKFNAYLEKKERLDVTAVFAYNDVTAFIAARLLREHGYRMPDDVALVGFDNTFLAHEMAPQLTSVSQPIAEIGRSAVEMLLGKIQGGKKEQPSHLVLEPTLVVRESTRKTNIL